MIVQIVSLGKRLVIIILVCSSVYLNILGTLLGNYLAPQSETSVLLTRDKIQTFNHILETMVRNRLKNMREQASKNERPRSWRKEYRDKARRNGFHSFTGFDFQDESNLPSDFINKIGLSPEGIQAARFFMQAAQLQFINAGLPEALRPALLGVRLHSFRIAKLTALYWQANSLDDFYGTLPFENIHERLKISRLIGQLLHDIEKRSFEILLSIDGRGELNVRQRKIMQQHVELSIATFIDLINDPKTGWRDRIFKYAHLPTILAVLDHRFIDDKMRLMEALDNIQYDSPQQKESDQRYIADHWDNLSREASIAYAMDYFDAMYDLSRNYRQQSPILPTSLVYQILYSFSATHQIDRDLQQFLITSDFMRYYVEHVMPLIIWYQSIHFDAAAGQVLINPLLQQLVYPQEILEGRIYEKRINWLYKFYRELSMSISDKAIQLHIEMYIGDPNFIDDVWKLLENIPESKQSEFFEKRNSSDPLQRKHMVVDYILRSIKRIIPSSTLTLDDFFGSQETILELAA